MMLSALGREAKFPLPCYAAYCQAITPLQWLAEPETRHGAANDLAVLVLHCL